MMQTRPASSVGSRRAAFTLIEIMVVVAIMGLILTMGIPSIYHLYKREGMRAAVNDFTDACSNARAQAILHGTPVELIFYPREKRYSFTGGGGPPPSSPLSAGDAEFLGDKPAPPKSGGPGVFPEDITLEMLDINLSEYRESDWARVRFFPNGTCDEMTVVLRSDKNEWRKISLEVTTGLASVEAVK
jgi:type II secretion system protein H